MMLTFDKETSRPATGAHQPVGSHMREWGHSPRNSIQLRTSALPEVFHPVASSRVEEMTTHPFIQFVRDIACVCAFSLFLVALGVVAAIVRALVFNPF